MNENIPGWRSYRFHYTVTPPRDTHQFLAEMEQIKWNYILKQRQKEKWIGIVLVAAFVVLSAVVILAEFK